MKTKLSLIVYLFFLTQGIFAQLTKSSLVLKAGTVNYYMQNILNNNITYNNGTIGLFYDHKIDTTYFIRAGYANGGVPDNTANFLGDYSKLKASFDKYDLLGYKNLKSTAKGSIAIGLGFGFQTSYFQCYNCNILTNYRKDFNLNASVQFEKKLNNSLSLLLLLDASHSLANSINESNKIFVNNPTGGYDVLKNSSAQQIGISLGLKYIFSKKPKKLDLDDDKDSVTNSKDKCPQTPIGTKVDEFGCPVIQKNIEKVIVRDTVKVIIKDSVKVTKPQINQNIAKKIVEIANEINFVTNQSELLPESMVKLNDLILILLENPSFNLIISGHTDDVGSAESNLVLSEKRTNAVIQYLSSHGIKNDRLVGLFYGETKLKVNDTSNDARSTNRRVELKVFEK